jgi:sugar/nucleoside kinase (ribokinase family)
VANEVVVVGGAVIDIISLVDKGLKTIIQSSNPGTITYGCGGVGRNIACSIGSIGISTSLVTVLGNDDSAEMIILDAKNKNVNMNYAVKLADPTCRTARYNAVHGTEGDLIVGVADMAIFEHLLPELLKSKATPVLSSCQIIVADGNIPISAIEYLALCSVQFQKLLCFEPTSDHKCLLPLKAKHHVIQTIDIIKPNFSELTQMIQYLFDHAHKYVDIISSAWIETARNSLQKINLLKNLSENAARGNRYQNVEDLASLLMEVMTSSSQNQQGQFGKHIIVSLGSEGIIWCSNLMSTPMHIAAPNIPIEDIKHTNGAGDAWLAGFLGSIVARFRLQTSTNSNVRNLSTVFLSDIEAGMKSAENRIRGKL